MSLGNPAAGYVFEPLPIPARPVAGTDRLFPVHRIYCVGRNYAEHAVEMGYDPTREPPFFFQKNPDNLLLPGQDFPYPSRSQDVSSSAGKLLRLTLDGAVPQDNPFPGQAAFLLGLTLALAPGRWPPPTWSATSSPPPARAWRTPGSCPRWPASCWP